MQQPLLIAIAARSKNNVIGRDGQLPWHISEDLKFFSCQSCFFYGDVKSSKNFNLFLFIKNIAQYQKNFRAQQKELIWACLVNSSTIPNFQDLIMMKKYNHILYTSHHAVWLLWQVLLLRWYKSKNFDRFRCCCCFRRCRQNHTFD